MPQREYIFSGKPVCFSVKPVWNNEVPPKVSYLAWIAYCECILTPNNLQGDGTLLTGVACLSLVKRHLHIFYNVLGGLGVWSSMFIIRYQLSNTVGYVIEGDSNG